MLIAVSAVFMSNAQSLGGSGTPDQKSFGLPPTVSGRFGLETIDYNVFGNVLKVIFSHSIRSGVVTLTSLDLGISFQSSFSYSRPVSSVLVPGPTYGGQWEIRVESPGCNFLSLVFNADWLQTFHPDLP